MSLVKVVSCGPLDSCATKTAGTARAPIAKARNATLGVRPRSVFFTTSTV